MGPAGGVLIGVVGQDGRVRVQRREPEPVDGVALHHADGTSDARDHLSLADDAAEADLDVIFR
ncbi:MAG: hypothetical protein ABJC61_01815, partial [Acidobacteriota bacterium]